MRGNSRSSESGLSLYGVTCEQGQGIEVPVGLQTDLDPGLQCCLENHHSGQTDLEAKLSSRWICCLKALGRKSRALLDTRTH